jgi:hypothetical protein
MGLCANSSKVSSTKELQTTNNLLLPKGTTCVKKSTIKSKTDVHPKSNNKMSSKKNQMNSQNLLQNLPKTSKTEQNSTSTKRPKSPLKRLLVTSSTNTGFILFLFNLNI